jgi:hypothetical protein
MKTVLDLSDMTNALSASVADVKAKPRKKSKGSGNLSLKTLALTKLGREIQNAGKAGHDSFEDALAARDLVHWHICNPCTMAADVESEQGGQVASLLD